MGYFSWTCAHCQHSILVQPDEGINDWMNVAVVVTADGETVEGAYDGFGNLDGTCVERKLEDGVMVHLACWEVAGKPGLAHYRERGLESKWAKDQGCFFRDEHDVIDPRVTDAAERERLLVEGRERRVRARFDDRASEFGLLLRDSRNEDPERAWRVWFPVVEWDDGMYRVTSRLEEEEAWDPRQFEFEKDAEQVARALYSSWLESEEFAKLKARSDELVEEARLRYHEKLKKEGRYGVECRYVPGDTLLNDGPVSTTGRAIFYVVDKRTRQEIVVLDGPSEAMGYKTFVAQPEYRGNGSPEWEARVQEIRAAAAESRRLANAEASRMNLEWAASGYPTDGRSS